MRTSYGYENYFIKQTTDAPHPHLLPFRLSEMERCIVNCGHSTILSITMYKTIWK